MEVQPICDFFTYVMVPACFLIETELLPHAAWTAVPVLASCYGFSQDNAKTSDHFFTGFPSYWNVLVAYLYLFEISASGGLAWILSLSALVFVPLRYIYPSRTRVLRPLSLLVLAVWLLQFSWIAVHPDPDRFWLSASLFGPAYYMGLSAVLNVWRPRSAAA